MNFDGKELWTEMIVQQLFALVLSREGTCYFSMTITTEELPDDIANLFDDAGAELGIPDLAHIVELRDCTSWYAEPKFQPLIHWETLVDHCRRFKVIGSGMPPTNREPSLDEFHALREKTGEGLLLCRDALRRSNNDFTNALVYIERSRHNGILLR